MKAILLIVYVSSTIINLTCEKECQINENSLIGSGSFERVEMLTMEECISTAGELRNGDTIMTSCIEAPNPLLRLVPAE